MDYALEFANVSKLYTLGGHGRSLREAVPNLLRSIAGRATPDKRPTLWALKDVSFAVLPGEALALIGANGAGKTTALKLATSVTYPTSGRVQLRGRASALIELGAGFHPDLTGRENILLNAAILGMRRDEITARFDEIVEFSELEAFLDTPVKRYSSGMYARLGFSVAAHVRPDVLIVDEVLAVGDATFQAKCLARMAEMRRNGTTIVVVSHALPRLQRLCSRGILLHRGRVIQDGPIDGVIATYQDSLAYSSSLHSSERDTSPVPPQGQGTTGAPARIVGVEFLDANRKPLDYAMLGDPLVIRIRFESTIRIQDAVIEVWFHGIDGTEIAAHTTQWDGIACPPIEGVGFVDLVVDPVPFARGRYTFSVALTASDGISRYDFHHQRYPFAVRSSVPTQGTTCLTHDWEWPDGGTGAEAAQPVLGSEG